MTQQATEEQNGPPAEKKRWWRFLVALVLLGILGLIILSSWVYHDQTYFINQTLNRFPALNLKVEKARVNFQGDFEIENLVWKNPKKDGDKVELPILKGRIDWSALPEVRLPKLEINYPKLQFQSAPENKEAKATTLVELENKVAEAVEGVVMKTEDSINLSSEKKVRGLKVDALVIREAEIALGDDVFKMELSAKGIQSENHKMVGIDEFSLKGSISSPIDSGKSPIFTDGTLNLAGELRDRVLILNELNIHNVEVIKSFSIENFKGATPSQAATEKTSNPTDLGWDELQIKNTNLMQFRVELNETHHGLRLSGSSNLHLDHIRWTKDGDLSIDSFSIEWKQMSVDGEDDFQVLTVPNLKLEGKLAGKNHLQLSKVTLTEGELYWGSEIQDLIAQLSATKGEKAESSSLEVSVHQVDIKRSKLDLNFGARETPFQVKGVVNASLRKLSWKDGKFSADETQRLETQKIWMGYPKLRGKSNPLAFLEFPYGLLEINYQEYLEKKRLQTLLLDHPVLRVSSEVTPWWEASDGEKSSSGSTDIPFWKRLNCNHLQVDGGKLEVLLPEAKFPRIETEWSIETTSADDGESIHQLTFHEISAKLQQEAASPFPVAQIPLAQVKVRLPDLWMKRHIEAIRIDHASVEASEPLIQSFKSKKDPRDMDLEVELNERKILKPTPLVVKPWTVGALEVADSYISINSLIPGIPTLRFGIQFAIENAPLELMALKDHLEAQQVHLSQINIPSPYEPLRNVAQLNEVVLTFSLEGLMNQTIDKIEINQPRLFVGEDLFWYVDYYRNYQPDKAMEDTVPGWSVLKGNSNQLVSWKAPTSEALVHQSIRKLDEDWKVKRLEVHQGELILAPKGKPVKGFTKPFPFNLSTELAKGTLEAELDIPPDTYTLEDFKLELQGMKGKVQFNLPLKDRDNNLVETFQVSSIRWKDLKTGEAFLTLTYDAMGIYAKFGAEAYGGYVNGEINVYLDDSYHWDGWVSAKTVNTEPITRKLSPGSFLLDGKVDATVLGQGSKSEIYQADVNFVNATPGTLSIEALNDVIKKIPGDVRDIENQLSRISLETLRDFQYDTAAGKARIYGREGKADLSFKGPYGSRNFEINVYDHRWKIDDASDE